MSANKHIDRICCAALAAAVLLTLLLYACAGRGTAAPAALGYEGRLFDTTRVHTLDIVMDDWDAFLDTAESEVYTACAVIIDGEACRNVGLRAKGNTSLSQVARTGTDRYSFKVEFDHYEAGKTYHGLDKLSLNNLIQDDTCMKDYLVYRMMAGFGAAAPLCSYVWVTVNGADWGLYLAVEGIEDSFLARNYGTAAGALYKPDSADAGGGRGNGRGFSMGDLALQPNAGTDAPAGETPQLPDGEAPQLPDGETPQMPDGETPQLPDGETPQMPGGETFQRPDGEGGWAPQNGGRGGRFAQDGEAPQLPDGETFQRPDGEMPQMPGGEMPQLPDGETFQRPDGGAGQAPQNGGRGGGMDSADLKLQYIDDEPASYPNIFDNAKTDATAADKARLIAALKTLSGSDPAAALDTEAVLRYFVVHNFVCNDDSYTGQMIHNYYLYERDGKLAMLPWDYNLAFGGFGGGSAQDAVNAALDDALADRPMQSWIFASDEATQRYHALYADFLQQYFADDTLDTLIAETQALLTPYLEKDPTAFCTAEDFAAAVAALRQFVALRAQSAQGQLDGTVPATTEAQRQAPGALVDAGGLDLSAMGSMGAMGRP